MKELIVSVAGVWNGSEAVFAYTANEWKGGEDMGCVSIARGEAPASAQHIGAELKAVMAAVLWGKQNGYTSFTFYHSYEGVEKWVTGEWKANKQLPQAYRDWMRKQKNSGLDFNFSRNKAGSKISFAHQLANASDEEVMRARK